MTKHIWTPSPEELALIRDNLVPYALGLPEMGTASTWTFDFLASPTLSAHLTDEQSNEILGLKDSPPKL